jgi:hypothetical protein
VSRSRVHTALVYLGLAEDAELDARLREAPLNAWRMAAVAIALCVGIGLAVGVLWLVGIDISWRTPISLLIYFGAVSGAVSVARRLRRRGSAD